jgi:hypothetical protein
MFALEAELRGVATNGLRYFFPYLQRTLESTSHRKLLNGAIDGLNSTHIPVDIRDDADPRAVLFRVCRTIKTTLKRYALLRMYQGPVSEPEQELIAFLKEAKNIRRAYEDKQVFDFINKKVTPLLQALAGQEPVFVNDGIPLHPVDEIQHLKEALGLPSQIGNWSRPQSRFVRGDFELLLAEIHILNSHYRKPFSFSNNINNEELNKQSLAYLVRGIQTRDPRYAALFGPDWQRILAIKLRQRELKELLEQQKAAIAKVQLPRDHHMNATQAEIDTRRQLQEEKRAELEYVSRMLARKMEEVSALAQAVDAAKEDRRIFRDELNQRYSLPYFWQRNANEFWFRFGQDLKEFLLCRYQPDPEPQTSGFLVDAKKVAAATSRSIRQFLPDMFLSRRDGYQPIADSSGSPSLSPPSINTRSF